MSSGPYPPTTGEIPSASVVNPPVDTGATAPVSTPFYLNPIVWSKYALQVLALLVAFGYIHVTNDQSQLIIGLIVSVVTELGYQTHSAIVRTAELNATR